MLSLIIGFDVRVGIVVNVVLLLMVLVVRLMLLKVVSLVFGLMMDVGRCFVLVEVVFLVLMRLLVESFRMSRVTYTKFGKIA
jgi:hypothetical protein